ncbi:glycosyltransferase [Mesorhizobium sp. WSM4976]|uniref:glycosyltransferase n=1 Tax=Mesorhizobium sp. WSM4976 TaxID=3038549 RepID=UPI002416C06C|nr:glycosyltransferase [Mesorhizobium sp. WSM4976]MDG4893028.1 glycosyltransferase [Mesorhizobium sp. WSM4976]
MHSNTGRGPRGRTSLPIFFDPGAKRRIVVGVVGALLIAAMLLWCISFALSIYLLGKLPPPNITYDSSVAAVEASERRLPEQNEEQAVTPSIAWGQRRPSTDAPPPSRRGNGPASSARVYAYLPYWPEWNYVSLSENIRDLDGLLPEWYEIQLSNGELRSLGFNAPHQLKVAQQVAGRRGALTLLPVVDVSSDLGPGQIAAALPDEEGVESIARTLVREAEDKQYDGLCLDVSSLPSRTDEMLARLFRDLKALFKGTGRQTCLVSTLDGDAWMSSVLQSSVDKIVVLGFQEPGVGSLPGPLAAQDWFTQNISTLLKGVPPEKLVVALGTLGYDWASDEIMPRRLSYAEAARLAGLNGAKFHLDPPSLNSTTSFSDQAGSRHQLWLLDAVSAYNQLATLDRRGVGAVAIWPITDVDPGVWRILHGNARKIRPEALLREISIGQYVGYDGEGAFQKLIRAPEEGIRDVATDPASRLIIRQDYVRMPQPYTILRYGVGRPRTVALTFDDGPDPIYTPEILASLKARQVPAAFFVIGKNVLYNPDLVQRAAEEGHEIGVHTFFHPALERTSAWREKLELNATERLIASLTGKQTVLFRSPYGRSEGPLLGDEAAPMHLPEQSGYIVVGANIVAPDWKGISAKEIAAIVTAGVKSDSGNVIVLHDAGGNRSETAKAVPIIIDALRREGFSFVSLGALIGMPPDQVMPTERGLGVTFDALSFKLIRLVSVPLHWIFWAMVVAGVGRFFLVVGLAHLRRRHVPSDPAYAPAVTVLIPAYCEEETILGALSAVLKSDYPDLRVIVADDGSTDGTYPMMRRVQESDPRVRIIRQCNRGKFAALNHAYTLADTEFVVAIDADTVVAPDAIRLLVRHFQDPRIGAVAGNVKVGNRDRLLSRLQALEYVTSQNIDRRAAEVVNGMLVVPGAIGAWRRKAVEDAGFYSSQTLAEDADLTVSVIRKGYRVIFEEEAMAETDAPAGLRPFMRQRLRWLLGMMQTGWKHRSAIVEGRGVGLMSISELFLLGVVMTLFAPFVDLIFAATLADRILTFLSDPEAQWTSSSLHMVVAYTAFLLSDLVMAALAFRFEPTEDKRLLLLFPLQRFFYRQLLCLSTYRALVAAVSGRLMRWRKASEPTAGNKELDLSPSVG